MDIKQLKPQEISEMRDFLDQLDEYGHIYHFPPEKLDEPFKKIIEGIKEVQYLQKESLEM